MTTLGSPAEPAEGSEPTTHDLPQGAVPSPRPAPEDTTTSKPETTKKEQRKTARWLVVSGAVAAALIVFIVGVKVGGGSAPAGTPAAAPATSQSATIYMPNVVGMTGQAAANELDSLAGIPTVYITGGTANANMIVTSQTPQAGTIINSSTRVELDNAASYASSTPTYSPPAPAATPDLSSGFGAGTYDVGTDPGEIAPGTYRTSGASWCYWARLKDTTGDFSSIIANGNANGSTSVTIKSGDGAFQVSGTCTFSKK